MEYCLKYTNICTKLNRADEIQIKYIEDKGLIAFLEKFSSKRVNLLIEPAGFADIEVRKLVAIRKSRPELRFAAALTEYNEPLMRKLREADIPFYMSTPCLNWELFHILLDTGVSDLNISGPLAFNLTKVKRIIAATGRSIRLRVTANKCLNLHDATPPIIGFFIRPEDVAVYEGLIDVIDFEGLQYQDTFFSIYAEQKMFIGNLNQCIFDFKDAIDNKGLISLFGERRRDCGRQCLIDGRCRRCYDLADLAKPMGDRAREKILETIKREQEKMKSSEN